MSLRIDRSSDSGSKSAYDRFTPTRKYTLTKQATYNRPVTPSGTNYTKCLNAVFAEHFSEKIWPTNSLVQWPSSKPPFPLLRLSTSPRKSMRLSEYTQDFYTNNLDWGRRLIAVNGTYETHTFDLEEDKHIKQICSTSPNLLTCVKWSHSPSIIGCGDCQSTLKVTDIIAKKSIFRAAKLDTQKIMSMDWRNFHEVTIGTGQRVYHLDVRVTPRFQTPICIVQQSKTNASGDFICALTWHQDQFLFATGSDKGLVKVFDIRRSITNQLHAHTHLAAVKALQWVPNAVQPTLLSGGGRSCGRLKVVNINTHQTLCEASADAQISSVAFLKKGYFVAGLGYPLTQSNDKLQIWHLNLKSQRLVKTFQAYEEEARILNISKKPHSTSFAVFSEDGVLSTWNVIESAQEKTAPFLEQQTIR